MKEIKFVCLVGAALLVGCSESQSLTELRGKECYVVYRRDALGYATDKEGGVDAETVFSSGTGELAARGELKEANDAWIVLETPEGVQAVPVSSILVVRQTK